LKYNRFIAIGDSFTEGMCDEKKYGQYRGWADRVADVMAQAQPGFQYANLSIRGKLLKQVVDEQLDAAIAQVVDKTTLVSFHAGANDVIRPKYNPNVILPLYAEAARKVAASGATVMLFTVLEDSGSEDVWLKPGKHDLKISMKMCAQLPKRSAQFCVMQMKKQLLKIHVS